MKRALTTLSVLTLFALVLTLLGQTFARTPAFNETLREDNVFGVSQLRFSAPMYDLPAYLFQTGMSYLRADLLVATTTGGGGNDLASVETALDRAAQAESYFERSLARAPANAHAWAALAWARTFQGDTDDAREALRRSWDLAPYHRQLAGNRLDLAEVLYASDMPTLRIIPDDDESRSLERDRAVIEIFGRVQP